MNKNQKIVAAGLVFGGVATIFSNKTNVDYRNTTVAKSAPQIVYLKEENEDTKIIKTESGFKKLTRVVADTPEPTKKPTVKPTKKPQKTTKKPQKTTKKAKKNSKKLYSSIPFTARFQSWIDEKCNEYGISTNVVMGVIKKESNFTIKAMGDRGKAYGLMQVQIQWHRERMKKVGATDLLNCYDNVLTGIDYLAELYRLNNCNWHKALMAYNGGQAYADSRCRRGIYSSEYSRKVMNYAENYKNERND